MTGENEERGEKCKNGKEERACVCVCVYVCVCVCVSILKQHVKV